jgi:hypothetical protein
MGLRVGAPAVLTMPALPGDTRHGRASKTSRALDPSPRTLLTEVDVANASVDYIAGLCADARLGQ